MWSLVTGGAKRLGAALCLSLADKGHSVVVHYNQSRQEAFDVVEQCRARGVEAEAIHGDFSSPDKVLEFARRYLQLFGETDVLINNIGDYLVGSVLGTSLEDWMHLFQVNLHTPYILTQSLSHVLFRNKGQVINIGVSGLHRHAASTHASAYMITKQGLLGLTLALAREWASQGVRVNMVSPGELDISVEQRPIPMGRPGSCFEVCRVVNFLLDRQSAYITGQNIEVAGGLGLGTH